MKRDNTAQERLRGPSIAPQDRSRREFARLERSERSERGGVIHYRVLADILLMAHFAFIAFVIGGGLLVLWRRWLVLLHLPAVAWGAYTELTSTICPLTPWEQALLLRAGDAGYRGGFIEHYILPAIYPAALTPQVQIVLGALVIAINVVIYAIILRRERGPKLRRAGRLREDPQRDAR